MPQALLTYIVPPLAATVGAVLGYILRGFENRRGEIYDRVNDIVSNVTKLQEVSTAYWSKTRAETHRDHEDLASEGEIMGRVHAINMMIEDIAPLIKQDAAAALRSSVVDLRMAVTGGKFASDAGRVAEPQAIQSGFRAGYELITRLRKTSRRKNLFSLF